MPTLVWSGGDRSWVRYGIYGAPRRRSTGERAIQNSPHAPCAVTREAEGQLREFGGGVEQAPRWLWQMGVFTNRRASPCACLEGRGCERSSPCWSAEFTDASGRAGSAGANGGLKSPVRPGARLAWRERRMSVDHPCLQRLPPPDAVMAGVLTGGYSVSRASDAGDVPRSVHRSSKDMAAPGALENLRSARRWWSRLKTMPRHRCGDGRLVDRAHKVICTVTVQPGPAQPSGRALSPARSSRGRAQRFEVLPSMRLG